MDDGVDVYVGLVVEEDSWVAFFDKIVDYFYLMGFPYDVE